jgi:lysophospholipase L1-like esterase
MKRLLLWISGLLIAPVVLGFWFHTSRHGAVIFGKYSPAYAAVACMVTVAGLLGWLLVRFLLREQVIVLSPTRRIEIGFPARAAVLLAFLVLVAVALELALGTIEERVRKRNLASATLHSFLQAVPIAGAERLRINHWGYRGEEIELEREEDSFRIFVIGGSTVYCDRLDFEDSHPRILQKLLQEAYPEIRIEVQNAGMHAHTTQHTLIKYLSRIHDFRPDLVIFYHAVNDMCHSFTPPVLSHGEYRPDYGHVYGAIGKIVNDYVERRGTVGLVTDDTIADFFKRYWFSDLRQGSDFIRRLKPRQVPVERWNSLPSYERNLRHMVKLLRADGVHAVMASQPYLYRAEMTEEEQRRCWIPLESCRWEFERPDMASMADGLERYNSVSRRVAAEMGVPYVDLEPLLPKSLEYFRDGVHYTAKGSRIVAEAFADLIVREGYVAPPAP